MQKQELNDALLPQILICSAQPHKPGQLVCRLSGTGDFSVFSLWLNVVWIVTDSCKCVLWNLVVFLWGLIIYQCATNDHLPICIVIKSQ